MTGRRVSISAVSDADVDFTLDEETLEGLRTARELVRDSRAQTTQDGRVDGPGGVGELRRETKAMGRTSVLKRG